MKEQAANLLGGTARRKTLRQWLGLIGCSLILFQPVLLVALFESSQPGFLSVLAESEAILWFVLIPLTVIGMGGAVYLLRDAIAIFRQTAADTPLDQSAETGVSVVRPLFRLIAGGVGALCSVGGCLLVFVMVWSFADSEFAWSQEPLWLLLFLLVGLASSLALGPVFLFVAYKGREPLWIHRRWGQRR